MALRSFKMRLSHAIKVLFLYCGVFAIIRRLLPNPRVAILRYHAVVDPNQSDYASPLICISPRDFERHVRYFARHYRVLSLDRVINAFQNGRPLPRNSVVFTFDDGYADNLPAARILKKYHATGTFYLTAACIDRQEPFWLFEVTYLPLKTQKSVLEIDLGGQTERLPLENHRQRWQAVRQLVRFIKSHDRATREAIRKQVREQLAGADYQQRAETVMLNWNQVREMLEMGMTIGAHTLTHLNLPNADPEDARREIRDSKTLLEDRLGIPVRHFSYPNSGPYKYYTEAVRQMVEESGYDSAVTSYAGFASAKDDRFKLHRVRTVPSLAETVAEIEWSKLKAYFTKKNVEPRRHKGHREKAQMAQMSTEMG